MTLPIRMRHQLPCKRHPLPLAVTTGSALIIATDAPASVDACFSEHGAHVDAELVDDELQPSRSARAFDLVSRIPARSRLTM